MPRTLSEIARALGAELIGVDRPVVGAATLEDASGQDLSLCADLRHLEALHRTAAAAVLLPENLRAIVPEMPCPALIVADVRLGLARAIDLLYPAPEVVAGIDPTAVVDPSARIDPTARIEPLAVVGARVRLGAGSVVGSGAILEAGLVVGSGCSIGARAVIAGSVAIGDRVRIGPGSVIGQPGFGFAREASGLRRVGQIGGVVIADDVEIGALCTIARGTLGATAIGAGSKIDDQVHIAHNVQIGPGVCIAAQTGISGSAVIGAGARLGGQVGIADRVAVGPGAEIGAKSGVGTAVPAGARVAGYPAQPVQQWLAGFLRERRAFRRRRKPGEEQP